jgi:VanZ family protein
MELGILITNWLPVVLWAGLIFYFSTDRFSSEKTTLISGRLLLRIFPSITAEQLALFDLFIRIFAHWAEYLVFAILFMRALGNDRRTNWSWRRAGWTLAVVLIYACTDELHQAYIPSRSANVGDVLLDLFGGSCGVLWMYVRRKTRAGKRNDRKQDRNNTQY